MTVSEHDRESIETIFTFCEKIDMRINNVPLEEFLNDEDIQDLIIRRILVIGEACTRLSSDFRKSNETLQISKIIGVRNILVHGYDAIDLESVYEISTVRVQELAAYLKSVL